MMVMVGHCLFFTLTVDYNSARHAIWIYSLVEGRVVAVVVVIVAGVVIMFVVVVVLVFA